MVLQPVKISDQVAGMVQHYWEHLAKYKKKETQWCLGTAVIHQGIFIFLQTSLIRPLENVVDTILWTLFQSSSFSKGKPLAK